MADDLTQDDIHLLENGANIFRALERATAVAREAIGLQRAFSEKRQQLDAIEAVIARSKAEVLEQAKKAVAAEQVQREQVAADELVLAAARHDLGKLREEYAATSKAQDNEYAEARGALRKRHAELNEALQAETNRLTREHDGVAKKLAELRALLATP